MTRGPSQYEKDALKSIHTWKNYEIGWFSKALDVFNQPLQKAVAALTSTPGIDWVMQKSVGGVISLLSDLANWSVRPESIYEDFRKCGDMVAKPEDILSLDLEQVDCAIGWLDAKYKSIAATEGGAAGLAGLPGIPADNAAVIALNQRAVIEYAAHCGFDASSQEERLFAMNILGLASSPTEVAKQAAMAQLSRIASDVASMGAWRQLEQHALEDIIERISQLLGIRLTRAKIAQIIPALGAGIGAGFNAYYAKNVCDAAFYLYRERFLARKYGPEILEITLKPAEDFMPDYDDARTK